MTSTSEKETTPKYDTSFRLLDFNIFDENAKKKKTPKTQMEVTTKMKTAAKKNIKKTKSSQQFKCSV